MDADSDNDAGFEAGRRRASPVSSRESSPAAKRQRRSFTPASDDGNPVSSSQDSETPMPENAPLIRQAVGFSSVSANVNTYQATVAPRPVVPYFLPGQAPPPPSKPKQSKPRAPRKKKGEHFSSQTSKFKLSGSASSPDSGFASLTTASPGNSAHTSPSNAPIAPSGSMIPITNHAFDHASGNTTATVTSNVLPRGVKRARKPPKKVTSAPLNDPVGQPSIQPPPRPPAPAPVATSVTQYSFNPSAGGSPTERLGPTLVRQGTYSTSPCRGPSGTPVGTTSPSTSVTRNSPQNVSRPVRMVTLLIEDTRSGVPDSQLAEVRVPLKVANDPEDGFWADAAEICEALQSGPSRIDGPAKVYTMRGKFRQFFMRVDRFDQLQVQSAYLGVSKERTLNVFVEAPMPQGQLPRPPVAPSDGRPGHSSGSEREATHNETCYRPTYSLVTREDQMERLSKSSYVVAQNGRYSPVSECGSYGHSRRTTSPQRPSRHDHYASPSRLLTPPIPGRCAETQDEEDEAIANYIRSHIENHPGWMDYMQSKAKPQRVSEVLKQYAFVEDRVRELIGQKTPAHWDGAPSSYVQRHHIWRVLRLDSKWGEECRETSFLVGFYGKNGSRYEDSRVVDMINDTSPPRANTMERFLHLLRKVDEVFTQDALRGQLDPTSP